MLPDIVLALRESKLPDIRVVWLYWLGHPPCGGLRCNRDRKHMERADLIRRTVARRVFLTEVMSDSSKLPRGMG